MRDVRSLQNKNSSQGQRKSKNNQIIVLTNNFPLAQLCGILNIVKGKN